MRIESPLKKFPGYVVLPEYLTVPQVQVISPLMGDPNKMSDTEPKEWIWDSDIKTLPAILACVSEWHLVGVPDQPTLDSFPMSPKKSVHALVMWLWAEIFKLWNAEDEIPNA